MARLVFLIVSLLGLAATVFANNNNRPCTTNADCNQNQICDLSRGTPGVCTGGCFPGDALVELFTGEMKAMMDLSVGDKIADGKDSFSEIYAFGHKESSVITEFVQVKTNANTLELTAGHFIPVNVDGHILYKRAADLKVGDIVSTKSRVSEVTELSKVEKVGLYNPLTLSGSILVNGVEASVHSEWFLDSLFDALGATEYLPYAYQSLLAPIRALYTIAGHKLYSAGYAAVDSAVNVADFGTKYGGSIALAFGLGALALATKSF